MVWLENEHALAQLPKIIKLFSLEFISGLRVVAYRLTWLLQSLARPGSETDVYPSPNTCLLNFWACGRHELESLR